VTDEVLAELAQAGATCEKYVLGEHRIRYCEGHDECEEWDECPVADDAEAILTRMWAADALVVASPVYGDTMSGQLKVLFDRCCHRYNHGVRLRAAAVGLVAVSWGTGLDETLDDIERSLAKRCRGSVPMLRLTGIATRVGDAAENDELLQGARRMGRGLARLLDLSGPAHPPRPA
jgi:multimeric flavodoxin WrbA